MRRQGRKRVIEQRDSVHAANNANLTLTRVRNPFSPIEPLSAEQLQDIHHASLRIASEHGLEIMSKSVLKELKKHGQLVDVDSMLARFDADFILEHVAKAPSQFTLTPYNADNYITIGDNHINFGLVSGTPNVHDAINGRRRGNMGDYVNLMKLYQAFPHLHFIGNLALPPQELPVNNRHLDTYYASLTHTDKLFFAQSIGQTRVFDLIEMQAIARNASIDDVMAKPAVITNINVNSPLKLDDMMIEGALTCAKYNQASIVTPFTLMGAMTPITLAAALAQQNAEALMTIAIIQLLYPGAPIVYGGFTSNVDMRSGAPCFGTPENSLANMAGGQLARYYNLPYRTSACNASNAVDAQSTYETQMAMWGAFLGHGNLIYHAAGWLEGGLVASFEKLMIDQDNISGFIKLCQPIDTSPDAFAADAFKEVGPGGHFFGCTHTMQRYQNAFWESSISDWQNNENWQDSGSKNATERATILWQDTLNNYKAPTSLPPDRVEALGAFIAKRKEQIGHNDI